MTHNKRAKNSRQRGTWTHGWGAKKKHRGAGHRGGRGRAGSGKKGDVKKPSYWADKNFGKGKIGFASLRKPVTKTINLSHLNDILDTLVKNKKAENKNGTYIVDLNKLKYQKLLGAGKITKKVEVTIIDASEKAKAKIAQAGGKLTVTKKPKKVKENKTDKPVTDSRTAEN